MEALIARWYKHGVSVNDWYKRLTDNPDLIQDTLIRNWFYDYKPKDLRLYHVFHDCGKPFCVSYDTDGKEHYPDHSRISSEKFLEIFSGQHQDIARMILHDMDFHTKRGHELCETWSLPFADDLYATAWSELYANADLFGGFNSDSFKIKKKRLIKALKQKPL